MFRIQTSLNKNLFKFPNNSIVTRTTTTQNFSTCWMSRKRENNLIATAIYISLPNNDSRKTVPHSIPSHFIPYVLLPPRRRRRPLSAVLLMMTRGNVKGWPQNKIPQPCAAILWLSTWEWNYSNFFVLFPTKDQRKGCSETREQVDEGITGSDSRQTRGECVGIFLARRENSIDFPRYSVRLGSVQ